MDAKELSKEIIDFLEHHAEVDADFDPKYDNYKWSSISFASW